MATQSKIFAPPVNFLRPVLLSNAVFSALTGLVCLFDARPVAAFMGLESPWVLRIVGAILLLFAALVAWIGLRAEPDRRLVQSIFALDVAWVIGSVLVLLMGWIPFTTAGAWAFALVADGVALFAVLEWIGLRRMRA